MKAFILGAGLGTRLRPLTARRPKPLIPVGGRPLITYAFDHLLEIGVTHFVVNTHWCAERYEEFFPDHQYRSIPITFVHEKEQALETAGGIWNAREFLKNGPFVVYNGDILSTLPIARGLEYHQVRKNEVTLLLRSEGANRNVTFDDATGRLLDLRKMLRPDLTPGHLFTGIYFVEPEFIVRIPPEQILSVIPLFQDMIQQEARVGAVVCNEGEWRDLGTREEYIAANRQYADRLGNILDPNSVVDASAVLNQTIVWENCTVAAHSKLARCVVTDGNQVTGCHEDRDF